MHEEQIFSISIIAEFEIFILFNQIKKVENILSGNLIKANLTKNKLLNNFKREIINNLIFLINCVFFISCYLCYYLPLPFLWLGKNDIIFALQYLP